MDGFRLNYHGIESYSERVFLPTDFRLSHAASIGGPRIFVLAPPTDRLSTLQACCALGGPPTRKRQLQFKPPSVGRISPCTPPAGDACSLNRTTLGNIAMDP